MSVKKLVLKDEDLEIKIEIEAELYCFYCSDKDWFHSFRLDHNQAHLLMLYLQEHLK